MWPDANRDLESSDLFRSQEVFMESSRFKDRFNDWTRGRCLANRSES